MNREKFTTIIVNFRWQDLSEKLNLGLYEA